MAVCRFFLCILILYCGVYLEAAGHGGHGEQQDVGESSWSPHVTYNGPNIVVEGSSIIIQCTLTLFDQLKWMHNSQPITKGDGGYAFIDVPGPHGFVVSKLIIESAQKQHSGEYRCTGFSPLFHFVFVIAGESQDTENSKLIRKGSSLNLSCNISTSVINATNQDIIWAKDNITLKSDDHINIYPGNFSLFIMSTTDEDVGQYKCEAKGYPNIYKIINVVTLSYKKLPQSTTVLENDKLSITCDADGIPIPTIEWFKDGIPVTEVINETRMNFSVSSRGVPNAIFQVDNVVQDDKGMYKCAISSDIFHFETETLVRVKDIYAALWPFLGIVAEVVLLCLIIFIYERRRVKADFEESDTDQGPEAKATPDQNKKSDVRHRK